MNRIILIGNGFDLAHGLKTSYADFINWYWDRWGDRLIHGSGNVESDRLCSFSLIGGWKNSKWYNALGCLRRDNPSYHWDEKLTVELAKDNKNFCSFTFLSPFFKEICSEVETKGWVDIENIYYEYLSHKSTIAIDAKVVNGDLDFIRENLIKYLQTLEQSITPNVLKANIKNLFIKPFEEKDFAINANVRWQDVFNQRIAYDETMWNGLISSYFDDSNTIYYNCHNVTHFISQYKENGKYNSAELPHMLMIPDRTMLLNFNYTNTADQYMSHSRGVLINHIHGGLSNPDSIIFGYGDELDENYKTIVNTNNNEYLRNIKSIKYLESAHYRELLKFIESDLFQIYIMGHSCGNSDRTLLNTLFEHKNCVSIKPFYHKKEDGSDNYIELIQNISRNFTDMKLMRDRVVNKTYCETLE